MRDLVLTSSLPLSWLLLLSDLGIYYAQLRCHLGLFGAGGGFTTSHLGFNWGGNILLTSSLPLSRTEKDSKRGPSKIEREEGNPGKQHGKTRQRESRQPQGRTAKAWTPPTFPVVDDDDDDGDDDGDDADDDDDDEDVIYIYIFIYMVFDGDDDHDDQACSKATR